MNKKIIYIILALIFQSSTSALAQENKSNYANIIMSKVFEQRRLYSKITESGSFDYIPSELEQTAWDIYNNSFYSSALNIYRQDLEGFKENFIRHSNKKNNKINQKLQEIELIFTNSYEVNAYYDFKKNKIKISLGLILAAEKFGEKSDIIVKLFDKLNSKKMTNEEFLQYLLKIDEYEEKLFLKLQKFKPLENENIQEREIYKKKLGNSFVPDELPEHLFPVIPNVRSYLKVDLPYTIKINNEIVSETKLKEIERQQVMQFLEFFMAHELCHAVNNDKVTNTSSHIQEYNADRCAIKYLQIIREDDSDPSYLPLLTLFKLPGVPILNDDYQKNPLSSHPHPFCRVANYFFDPIIIAGLKYIGFKDAIYFLNDNKQKILEAEQKICK